MCTVQHVEMKSSFTFQPTKLPVSNDCRKCKTCSQMLNIPFEDQKPTIMFSGGNGAHCFARKMSLVYEEKTSPFLKKLLRQSQSSTPELDPKKAKFIPFMA